MLKRPVTPTTIQVPTFYVLFQGVPAVRGDQVRFFDLDWEVIEVKEDGWVTLTLIS